MTAVLVAMVISGLNVKERASVWSLFSGTLAGIFCAFSISITWGLGVSGAILLTFGMMLGYEG